jgi:transposase
MPVIKYKQKGRISLFDKEETLMKLSKLGNPLEKVSKAVNFELFRTDLEANILNHNKKNNAGCRPFDVVMMFKIIVLKRLYHLSDKQLEYQIYDRLSFKEFLGLSSGDRVPNANTIRVFRKKIIQKNLDEKIFEQITI